MKELKIYVYDESTFDFTIEHMIEIDYDSLNLNVALDSLPQKLDIKLIKDDKGEFIIHQINLNGQVDQRVGDITKDNLTYEEINNYHNVFGCLLDVYFVIDKRILYEITKVKSCEIFARIENNVCTSILLKQYLHKNEYQFE